MAPHCEAVTNPDSIWPPFCPNIGAAYAFAVLFGLISTAHCVQMFVHRKPYSWVITFSALLQTATYVLRILSIMKPANGQFYSDWFILMMVAPVWTNAYAYMVMGRMVYNFTPSASVFKIKAWRFGLIFVLLDILAFLVQLAGAAVASGDGNSNDTIMLVSQARKQGQQSAIANDPKGLHIYMGGIGFQQFCIFLFLALAIRLHRKLIAMPASPEKRNGIILLFVNYAVVALITIRIIFRLVEYSSGFESSIPLKEAYQYVFDSAVMMIALVLYNVFHPGRLMPGAESNLPSRKVRKGWKKAGQAPQGRMGARDEYLLPKYERSADSVSREASPSPDAAMGRTGYAPMATASFEIAAQQEQGYLHPGQAMSPPSQAQAYEPYSSNRH